jgi:hypothetical protein
LRYSIVICHLNTRQRIKLALSSTRTARNGTHMGLKRWKIKTLV